MLQPYWKPIAIQLCHPANTPSVRGDCTPMKLVHPLFQMPSPQTSQALNQQTLLRHQTSLKVRVDGEDHRNPESVATVSGSPFFPRSALLRPGPRRQGIGFASLRALDGSGAGPGSRIYYEEKRGSVASVAGGDHHGPLTVFGFSWDRPLSPGPGHVPGIPRARPGQAPCLWHLSRGSA